MNGDKIKIMIVEDEAMIALDIQERLMEMGYDVPAMVNNGKEAIELAGKHLPKLVLMDIVIRGDMDGIETAEIIKDMYNIPSLFLTAYDNDATLQRAKKVKPLGYLLKPFDDSKLQEIILDMQIKNSINPQ
jgi:two-component system, response regulator PdtaR